MDGHNSVIAFSLSFLKGIVGNLSGCGACNLPDCNGDIICELDFFSDIEPFSALTHTYHFHISARWICVGGGLDWPDICIELIFPPDRYIYASRGTDPSGSSCRAFKTCI